MYRREFVVGKGAGGGLLYKKVSRRLNGHKYVLSASGVVLKHLRQEKSSHGVVFTHLRRLIWR